MQVCKFYLRSRCNKGSACQYSHDDTLASRQDPRRLVACKFLQKGQCLRGDECAYSHSSTDTLAAMAQVDQEPLLRTMGGAVVRFGSGATVTRLSMVQDFSSVRIDGLSEAEATFTNLPSLLKSFGHSLLPTETVKAIKLPGSSNVSVYVTSDTRDFAQRFCAGLKASGTSKLSATPVPPKFPPGTITRQTNCKKVVASWCRPTRAVWIHFDTYAEAGVVSGKFNREEFTLGGVSVEAGLPQEYKGKWKILLRNAPLDITEARVRMAMRSSLEVPSYIRLGDQVASFEEEAAPAFVSSLFRTVGKVDYMTEAQSKGRWWNVAIHFENELDALTAVDKLHNQPREFLGDEKLTVRLVTASKIKIPRKIHSVIREQIELAVKDNSQGHRLSVKVFPDTSPENRFVMLSMQGEDKGKLTALTGTIESMLSGKVIEVSDDIFETLVKDRSAARQLKEIQRVNQVLVVTKKGKKELVFFGPPTKYETVQRAVLDMNVAIARFTYQLNENEYAWMHWGGFRKLTSALGDDVVSLNTSLTPKSIIINGTKQQYQQARSILETRGGSLALNLKPPEPEAEACSICWTPAEDPVMLVCGHLYCAECLKDLCRSSSSDEAEFSIICKGDSDTCKRSMSLDELETHLSSKAFEDVLRISFDSYITRRADLYHFCPSPDCGYIYTVREDQKNTTSTCLGCSRTTCTSCHAQHGATSCADYNYERSGGDAAFIKYKKEHGGKDCPKCKTYIEKIDGCNHMVCGGCRAHICWVCLDVFHTSDECYKHLKATHGGFGIPMLEDDLLMDLFVHRMHAMGIDRNNRPAIVELAQAQRALGQPLPEEVEELVAFERVMEAARNR